MRLTQDLIGQRFGRLVVIAKASKHSYNQNFWHCRCDCGKETIVTTSHLRSGHSKSCGCLQKHIVTKHGNSQGKYAGLCRTWYNMIQRVKNPLHFAYKNYGARGISMCPEWEVYENFKTWAVANGWKQHLTIERIDVNGDYTPENCKWITKSEQPRNKRNNVLITLDGEVMTKSEAARKIGVSVALLSFHIRKRGVKEGILKAKEHVEKENAVNA